MNTPAPHRMFLHRMAFGSLLAGVLFAAATSAQPAKPAKFVMPKTEFGHPDLRGVWNFSSNTPIERPAKYKEREFMTAEEAAKQHQQIQERSEEADNSARAAAVSVAITSSGSKAWRKARICEPR